MQKQEDERKEKGPEKMDAVNEEYGYSPDIGDEYKQLIKEGDRRRKRTEKGRRKRYEQGYTYKIDVNIWGDRVQWIKISAG